MAAIAVEVSNNKKLGKVSATYVSQESCPKDCSFYKNGCYAETGYTGIITTRLAKLANKLKLSIPLGKSLAIKLAKLEAKEIAKLTSYYPLRLHVVGDSRTNTGTKILANAAKQYGNKVWTYTHAWRKVKRKNWGTISVLASVESIEDIAKARKVGYATAIVVPEFLSKKKYELKRGRLVEKIIPCPNQTTGVQCDKCRLCMNDKFLKKNKLTIGFAAHGVSKGRIQEWIKKEQ